MVWSSPPSAVGGQLSSALCTGMAASQAHKPEDKHKWTQLKLNQLLSSGDARSEFPACFQHCCSGLKTHSPLTLAVQTG